MTLLLPGHGLFIIRDAVAYLSKVSHGASCLKMVLTKDSFSLSDAMLQARYSVGTRLHFSVHLTEVLINVSDAGMEVSNTHF